MRATSGFENLMRVSNPKKFSKFEVEKRASFELENLLKGNPRKYSNFDKKMRAPFSRSITTLLSRAKEHLVTVMNLSFQVPR